MWGEHTELYKLAHVGGSQDVALYRSQGTAINKLQEWTCKTVNKHYTNVCCDSELSLREWYFLNLWEYVKLTDSNISDSVREKHGKTMAVPLYENNLKRRPKYSYQSTLMLEK